MVYISEPPLEAGLLNLFFPAPCGAIANSLFNDSFFLVEGEPTISDADLLNPKGIAGRIPMTGKDIAWATDKVSYVNKTN